VTDCQCAETDYKGDDAIPSECWNCGRTLTIRADTPVLDEILIHPARYFFDAIRYRGHREGPSEYHRTLKPPSMAGRFDFAPEPEQSFFYDYA